jgi:Flp pilus assembly protein TadD
VDAPARQQARALLEVGRWAQALEVLSVAIGRTPDDAEALCLLARCHEQAGRSDLMLAAADRAVQADPAYEWGHRLRAYALLALKRLPPAEAAARTAVTLAPDAWQSHSTLAAVLLGRGGTRRLVAARRSADTVLRLAPREPDAHMVDAAVRIDMADFGGARRACERALELDPQHQAALHNLAVVDLARDRVGAAARGFSDALALDPHDSLTGRGHALSARAVLWRLFDALVGTVVAHTLLFHLTDRWLGDWRRAVELAAAGVILGWFGWYAARTWRGQSSGIRWRLRSGLVKHALGVVLLLMAMAAIGLVLSAYAPEPRSVADNARAVLLFIPIAVFVFRLRGIVLRRVFPAVRRLWFRLWVPRRR